MPLFIGQLCWGENSESWSGPYSFNRDVKHFDKYWCWQVLAQFIAKLRIVGRGFAEVLILKKSYILSLVKYFRKKERKKCIYALILTRSARVKIKKKKKMKLALVIELCDFIKYGYGCWVEL